MNRRDFSHLFIKSLAISGLGSASLLHAANAIIMDKKPRKLIKPPRLKEGDTIGLIAPGSAIPEQRFEQAILNIQSMGFKPFYTDTAREKHGYLAGSDQQRLQDLHRMYEDDKIAGIWCLRGGYGCTRLLPSLNYKLICKNPKVLIGYSDVTALLQAIYIKTGIVGFHGPAAVSDFTDYTVQHLTTTLMHPEATQTISVSSENSLKDDPAFQVTVIREGSASGRLIGGNLSLLASLTGTDYQWSVKDKIVFIEDIGEKPYRIDRMLTQLLQSSRLNEAAAIILGVFVDCEAKPGSDSLSLSETLNDRLSGLGIPVIYGLSFGHIANQFTLPLGIEAHIDTQRKELVFLEPAVL